MIKQALANKETVRCCILSWLEPKVCFWYNNTLVELDLAQHQISFAGLSDVGLGLIQQVLMIV